jgi:PIN domain nuclease of toxin-antitoxin system
VNLLLDTHFLIWILLGADRLGEYPWLDEHRPWGVSPVSVLELQYLAEVGRIEVDAAGLLRALQRDGRFALDEPPLVALVERALPLAWTRDPFDRLLAAHSLTRRIPVCTVDRAFQRHHGLIVEPPR